MAQTSVNYMQQAKDLATQHGIDSKLFNQIQGAAEINRDMFEPTEQKKQVYDALQNYFKQATIERAQSGGQLHNPNPWKQGIYDQYGQSHLISQSGLENRLEQQSASKLDSMKQWLEQMAKEQIKGQEAQLGLARDEQLAQIDKALQEAINKGQLSVKEAQKQFENAKQQIYQQAYHDSELTNLAGYDRGIQNSAQMIGLMQGDQARRNSLLNQNLTTRDEQINAINNQLDQMKFGAGIDKALVNSKYNFGLAGATADINAQMMAQMANMSFEEWQRLAQNQFQMTQAEKDKIFQGNMADKQHQFDLEKMSVQQKYQLEQMAKQFGYDLGKMSAQQQYQLAQMAQAFGYDMSLQQSAQDFQAGQNSLDRNLQKELLSIKNKHDLSMLTAEQKAQMDTYYTELQRKLAQYTPGTDEYNLLNKEADWAFKMAQKENQANFASEIGAKELANLLSQYPAKMPDPSDKKAVDAYNKQVESINKQIQKVLGKDGAKNYVRDLAKSKGKDEKQTNAFMKYLEDSMYTLNPIMWAINKPSP